MNTLQQALESYQRGDIATTRQLIEQAIAEDPNNETAWVVKMTIAEHDFERDMAMNRVLTLNPNNERALALQRERANPAEPMPEPPPESVEPPRMGEPSAPKPPKPDAPSLPPLMSGTPGTIGAPSAAHTLPGMGNPQLKQDADDDGLGTYQMLWDCGFCGTEKLLGLDHRYCPNCGTQQRAEWRYFPDEADMVKVEDHVYHGVDVVCPSCQTLNSAAAEYCGQCGTPLTEAAKARVHHDDQILDEQGEAFTQGTKVDEVLERYQADQARIHGTPQPKAAKAPSQGWSGKAIAGMVTAGIAVMGCIGAVLFAIFSTSSQDVTVVGHEWQREIVIQKFQTVSEGDWCDSMENGAYDISRSERQRGSRQVPDGQECTTRRVDNGDGTFSTVQDCRTVYRSEPIYDDYCSYKVDKWENVRSVFADGNSLTDNLAWPRFSLADEGSSIGTQLGDEREGERIETYEVTFRASDGERYTCTFDDAGEWQRFPLESRWVLEVGTVMGDARCDSLQRAN